MLGGVEVEYLLLREAGLEPCRGCFLCLAEGEERCPCRDARDDVLARLDACDGAIFASPNYVQNVSGLYKTFVDRFAWCCHRPRFYAKPALAVATSGGPFGLKETLSAIQTGPASWGFVFVDEVGIGVHPRLGAGDESRREADRALDCAAKRLHEALNRTGPYRPERWRLFQFRSMRAITLARPDACPADTAFYRPLADRDFYVEARFRRSTVWRPRSSNGWSAGTSLANMRPSPDPLRMGDRPADRGEMQELLSRVGSPPHRGRAFCRCTERISPSSIRAW